MSTLNLKKDEPKEPTFDESAHYGEVGGVEGVRYVQGDNLFDNAKRFVRVAPDNMKMKPLTMDQELDRRARLQANKKFFAQAKPVKGGEMPENVVNAQRENSRARAAEHYAA